MAIRATFMAWMMGIFLEEIFQQALFGLFVAVTLFQMGFSGLVLWFFFRKFPAAGFADTPTAIQAGAFPGVSVIICARNESRNLLHNLPEVLAQQYQGAWELLVINDASEDATMDVLLAFQADNPAVHVHNITEKVHPGKKQALAFGIEAAKFDLILVTDADCLPASPHWLAHMVHPFIGHANIELVLGYGPMRRTPDGGFLERWTRFEAAFSAMQYSTFAFAGIPYMGVGRNLAFRKAAYKRAGGFAAHVHIPSGDDDLLVNATATSLNTSLCLHPDAFVYSQGKKNWTTWARQKKRHLAAGTAYKLQHQVLLGLLSLSHVLHYFLLLLLLLIGVKAAFFGWLMRILVLQSMYRKVFSAFHERGILPYFPIFDALIAVYNGTFVPFVLLGKKTSSWS